MRLVIVLLAVVAAGCGSSPSDTPEARSADPAPTSDGAAWPTAPADADAAHVDWFDPAYSLLPESAAAAEALVERLGDREDFRVPRAEVAGLADGALSHAVVARLIDELALPGERYLDLTEGQRAIFALWLADTEILNGGSSQLWFNETGYVAADLADAARRVGAREHARVFADAERLFAGGRIPRAAVARDVALSEVDETPIGELDQRYGDLQSYRRSLLAPILARYIRSHPREFFAR